MRIPVIAVLAIAVCGCGADALNPHFDETPDVVLSIEPNPVDFGEVMVGCVGHAAARVRNLNPFAVDIVGLELTGDSRVAASDFRPDRIESGEALEVALSFSPEAPGESHAEIFVSVAAPAPAVATSAALGLGAGIPETPVDLVVVLDVSTSMGAIMAPLHDAIGALFDRIENENLQLRLGLVTYVNDIVVHAGGASLSRDAFFSELGSQLNGALAPDATLARNTSNHDAPENALDALYRAADEFDFLPDSRRVMLVITDDTFMVPPAVYTFERPAVRTFAEVRDRLAAERISLSSVNNPYRRSGWAVGGAMGDDLGQGFSSPFEGEPSLVLESGGRWFVLGEVVGGVVTVDQIIHDAIGDPCAQ